MASTASAVLRMAALGMKGSVLNSRNSCFVSVTPNPYSSMIFAVVCITPSCAHIFS